MKPSISILFSIAFIAMTTTNPAIAQQAAYDRTYEWDMMSRLTKVSWSPNKTTKFRYNALGQRSETIELTDTTETAHFYYLYDGLNLLCRYNGEPTTANIDRHYLAQGEERKSGSTWTRYHYTRDHLGSIREVLQDDGTLAARYDYDPYGKRIAQYEATGYTGGCDLGFTGHITQQSPVAGQTELVMTAFRVYDPSLGRWLSEDSLGEEGGRNLYAYCKNNPINYHDPDGRDAIPNTNGQYIYVVNPGNFGFSTLVEMVGEITGKHVWNPKPGLSGQCAVGAQYLSGTKIGGKMHDSPKTRISQTNPNWLAGRIVGNSTIPGTMIATGWAEDGGYPNQPTGNHTGIYLGNSLILEQNVKSQQNVNGAWQVRKINPVDFREVNARTQFDQATSNSEIKTYR